MSTTAALARAPGAHDRTSLWAIGILGTVVLLEAIPTALWLTTRFQSAAEASPVSESADPGTPAALAAFVPCDPVTSSNRSAPSSPKPVSANASAPLAAASAAAARPPATGSAAGTLVAGALRIASPIAVHVYERGRLIGSSEAESLLLPAGKHDIEFVNETLGYRTRRAVTIQAGGTSAVRLEPPLGTLNINAIPWAEVWIDNERVGETPIGNLKKPIGSREVLFRHPEFGERRETVLVTLSGPARLSIDLRTK